MPSFTYNLRFQYLIFLILSSFVLIAITIITNQNIQNISSNTLNNSSLRVTMSSDVKLLHNHIDKANQLLNLFLLSPSNQYRQQFIIKMKSAAHSLSRIKTNTWITDNALVNEIADISFEIHQLLKSANKLMDMRLKNNEVFPVIAIAERTMFLSQNSFIDEVNLAIEEIRETQPLDLKLYDDFILIRDKWRRLIMAYRLYIIYQMGTLDKKISTSTISDIDIYSNDIIKTLNEKFSQYELKSNIGMQSKSSIDIMKKTALRWVAAFNEVKLIQIKGLWRADIPIVLDEINPIFDEIYFNLSQLELSINLSSVNDIRKHYDTSDTISNYIWIIISIFIFVLLLIYIVLDRILLKPISNLAFNMKNYRDINFSEIKIKMKSTEMNEFLHAFQVMQQTINKREEKLQYMALHDSLTSLPNRILLYDRMNVAINNYQRNKESFALFMLDLNKFKIVNDTQGHDIGDKVLVQAAHRLESVLRKSDTLARIGGDEFTILMLNINDQAISELSNKINATLEQTFEIGEYKINIGTSIGISIYPKHGFNNEMLMQKADFAMYHSKKNATDYTVYEPHIFEANSKRA